MTEFIFLVVVCVIVSVLLCKFFELSRGESALWGVLLFAGLAYALSIVGAFFPQIAYESDTIILGRIVVNGEILNKHALVHGDGLMTLNNGAEQKQYHIKEIVESDTNNYKLIEISHDVQDDKFPQCILPQTANDSYYILAVPTPEGAMYYD